MSKEQKGTLPATDGPETRAPALITKQEWFAGMAMQALIITDPGHHQDEVKVAEVAFKVADAMVAHSLIVNPEKK